MRPGPGRGLLRSALPSVVVLAVLAWAAPAQAIMFTSQTTLTYQGDLVEGRVATCTPGDTDVPPDGPITYEWRYVTPDAATPSSTDASTYTVKRADVNKQLVCRVHASQAADPDGADDQSAPAAVLQRATVRGAFFSDAVSGDIGANVAGIGVTVALRRDVISDADGSVVTPRVVSVASTATAGDGTWSLTLPGGLAPSNLRDAAFVTYTDTTPASGALPDNAEYSARTLPFDAFPDTIKIPADGTNVPVTCGATTCEAVSVTINGGAPIDAVSDGVLNWTATPMTPVRLGDRVDVTQRINVPASGNGTRPSLFVTTRPAPPPGVDREWNPPTCQADIANQNVRCRGVLPGQAYTIARNGGPEIPATAGTFPCPNQQVDPSKEGNTCHGPFVRADVPGLAAGDTVTLRTAANALMTTLRVAPQLRADFAPDGSISAGECPAFTYLDIPRSGTGAIFGSFPICPADGRMAGTQSGRYSYDDTSGGRTEIRPAQIADVQPADGAAVTGNGLTIGLKAAARYYADEVDGLVATADPIQVELRPRGAGGAPVVTAADANAGSAVTVPAAGAYDATWILTDRNGDRRVARTTFTVAQGPTTGGPGGGPGGGGGNDGGRNDAAAPAKLTALRISPKRFRAASSGPSATAAKAKKKAKKRATAGAVVSYKLDRAARVTFTVSRQVSGRQSGKSCVKPTRKNRKAKRCLRTIVLRGAFTHEGKAGQNRFRFNGRIAGRKLGARAYRLNAVTPAVGSAKGSTASTTFTIRR